MRSTELPTQLRRKTLVPSSVSFCYRSLGRTGLAQLSSAASRRARHVGSWESSAPVALVSRRTDVVRRLGDESVVCAGTVLHAHSARGAVVHAGDVGTVGGGRLGVLSDLSVVPGWGWRLFVGEAKVAVIGDARCLAAECGLCGHGVALGARCLPLSERSQPGPVGGGEHRRVGAGKYLRSDESGDCRAGGRATHDRVQCDYRRRGRTVVATSPSRTRHRFAHSVVDAIHGDHLGHLGRGSRGQHDGHHGRAGRANRASCDLDRTHRDRRAESDSHGGNAGNPAVGAGQRRRRSVLGSQRRHAARHRRILRRTRLRGDCGSRLRVAVAVGGQHGHHRFGEYSVHDGSRSRIATDLRWTEQMGNAADPVGDLDNRSAADGARRS